MNIYQLLTNLGYFMYKSSSDIFSGIVSKALKDTYTRSMSVMLVGAKTGSPPNKGGGWGWALYHTKVNQRLRYANKFKSRYSGSCKILKNWNSHIVYFPVYISKPTKNKYCHTPQKPGITKSNIHTDVRFLSEPSYIVAFYQRLCSLLLDTTKKLLLMFLMLGGMLGGMFAENAKTPPKQNWSFNKFNGTFDRAALQRGFQVYKEVCSTCHSIKLISFRHLKALGLTEAEIKALALQYQIKDGPNDDGEMFERQGRSSDYIPGPYANEKQARAANNGAFPPDQSLIVKARAHGADYVYALLTGFKDAPEDFKLHPGQYFNEFFPGNAISMAPPLKEDLITYNDGTKATVEQMAHDVTTFLAWASEPEMEERKRLGFKVVMYLLLMTGLFYATMRRIWKDIK